MRARRFGYEAEIIARAAWSGFGVIEVPVNCHYGELSRRRSHFRPWVDGAKGFFMHARLTLRRLNPWPVHRLVPQRHDAERLGALRRATLREQLSPLTFIRHIRRSRLDQLFLAAACGIGTFMAALPLGGWQFAAALYAGLRLRVHLFPLAVGTSLAYVGAGKYLQGLGLFMGHCIFHLSPPDASCWPLTAGSIAAGSHVAERVLGGIAVGFLCNWAVIGLLVVAFRQIPIRRFQPEKP